MKTNMLKEHKRAYNELSLKVIKLQHQAHLLAASDESSSPTSTGPETLNGGSQQ